MNHIQCAAILLGLFVSCSGCTTMSSTLLNRTGEDTYYKNSKTKGVPIRLEVDSHLDVYIEEQFLLFKEDVGDDEFELKEIAIPGRHLSVRTDLIKSHKLFTVDFKRPAAGFLEYGSQFDDYYFTQIDNKLDDETIEQSAALVAQVGSLLGIGVTDTSDGDDPNDEDVETEGGTVSGFPSDPDDSLLPLVGGDLDEEYFPQRRVVAYKRFDINSPCFEEDVQAFIDLHLNSCNQCEINDQSTITSTPVVAPSWPVVDEEMQFVPVNSGPSSN